MTLDEHVRVHRADPLGCHVDLCAADVRRAVEHLAVQVRGVDVVEVDDPERTDTRGREILRGGAPEAARPDQQHARVEQRALTLEADLRQDQVAPVAIVLLGRERRSGRIGHSGKLARQPFGGPSSTITRHRVPSVSFQRTITLSPVAIASHALLLPSTAV